MLHHPGGSPHNLPPAAVALAHGKKKRLERLERLGRVFQFIERNYQHDLTLEDAAKEANISVYYFARFFKEATDKTFSRYLTEFRIKKAQWRLVNSEENITDIAFQVGFNSTKTFNRMFKEITGCTPSEYRRANIETAAEMVRYCNIQKGYNVKYWIIGNEPDLYNDSGYIPGYTVADYIKDFKAYAAAMKAVDPNIKLIGPELAWKYIPGYDWLTPFLQACRDDVDIVSFHYYPYGNPGDFTIQNVLGSDAITRYKIQTAKNTVKAICGPDKPVALTETHVSWSSVTGQPASAETFYAGLWIADTAGISLQENLWTAAFWGTKGGYGTGFLNPDNTPRPSYYALQMFTTRFGKRLLSAESHPGVAAYASRNEQNDRTVLIVINKNGADQPETIRFTDFQTPIPERQYTLPAYSLTCLSIPDDGSAMECWSYTKDLADKKLPPEHKMIQ